MSQAGQKDRREMINVLGLNSTQAQIVQRLDVGLADPHGRRGQGVHGRRRRQTGDAAVGDGGIVGNLDAESVDDINSADG